MHHRKSPHAQRYDYTSPGCYFITICTKERLHYFGEIVDSVMILDEIGKMCENEIQKLSERTSVDIDEWVVMPNHIHMIIIVSDFDANKNMGYERRRDAFETRPDIKSETGQATSLSLHIRRDNYAGPRLGQIIGVLKGNITKYANLHNIPFARQSRYHDHIIRNEEEYAT